jgi:hypothetical protein
VFRHRRCQRDPEIRFSFVSTDSLPVKAVILVCLVALRLCAQSTYCISCERDEHGRIRRSAAARAEFKRQQPCPSTGKSRGPCPGYVIDHIKPLACGGADMPENMQWQHTEPLKRRIDGNGGLVHTLPGSKRASGNRCLKRQSGQTSGCGGQVAFVNFISFGPTLITTFGPTQALLK